MRLGGGRKGKKGESTPTLGGENGGLTRPCGGEGGLLGGNDNGGTAGERATGFLEQPSAWLNAREEYSGRALLQHAVGHEVVRETTRGCCSWGAFSLFLSSSALLVGLTAFPK